MSSLKLSYLQRFLCSHEISLFFQILDVWEYSSGHQETGGFRMGNTGIPVADSF